MAVVLLKLIFLIFTTLSNLITRFVFTCVAHVLVQMIRALKVPGDGAVHAIDQFKNVIRACLEYFSDIAFKAIKAVLSSLFDFLKEGVLSWSSGVAGLVEKSKASLDDAARNVPEVLEAFGQMVRTIVADLWSNCNDAMAYVGENVLK